jgi:hypothetical protein
MNDCAGEGRQQFTPPTDPIRFKPEGEGSMLLRNVGIHQSSTRRQPRRPQSELPAKVYAAGKMLSSQSTNIILIIFRI